MTARAHRLVMLARTWARSPQLHVDDVVIACADCACDHLGLVAAVFEETGELEVQLWDTETYSYDASARPGEPCYRPDVSFPPSLEEIAFRTGRTLLRYE